MALLERGALLERRGDLDIEALLDEGAPDPDRPGVRIGGVAHEDHGATTFRGRCGVGWDPGPRRGRVAVPGAGPVMTGDGSAKPARMR